MLALLTGCDDDTLTLFAHLDSLEECLDICVGGPRAEHVDRCDDIICLDASTIRPYSIVSERT